MQMDDGEGNEPSRLTTLTFIGTGSCTPNADNDTASFVLNGHVLVDCGWCAALMMRRCEYDATMLSHVLITHCHQDHYMGLASVLFYRAMQQQKLEDAADLTIAGPAEDIERIVNLTLAFLQADRLKARAPRPEVLPLKSGGGLRADELDITTAATRHAVPGLAYRLLDMDTGVAVGITGDTAYMPELADFFSGVDHLVAEGSTGLNDPSPDNEAGHQSVLQAARLAQAAGAKALSIVHTDVTRRGEFEAAAGEIFDGHCTVPWPGEQANIEDQSGHS